MKIKNYLLIGFSFLTLFNSCKKKEELPLNEQFQYKLELNKKVGSISSDYSNPSISVTETNNDNNLELLVSDEGTQKIFAFSQKSDKTFSEESNFNYSLGGNFLLTDYTSKQFNNKIHSFYVDKLQGVYYQTSSLDGTTHNINPNKLLTIPSTRENDGMIASFDFLNDGVLDLLIAKENSNQELRNVYRYNAKKDFYGNFSNSFDYDNHPYLELPKGTKSFDLADINNDGELDLIVLDKKNNLYFYDLIEN